MPTLGNKSYTGEVRIVAVADTHTFEADLGDLPLGDVFVHAGDMTRGGSLDEMEAIGRWICGLPHRHKVIIAGNHDWCFARSRDSAEAIFAGCHYLQDSGVVIDGVNFWGSPWQPEFHSWAFNLPRGPAIAAKWALIPDDTDVLITHGPPAGYGDCVTDVNRAGCDDLLVAARRVRPKLHMYGHIHQDGGYWIEGDIGFCNVTTWECERAATVIDVDESSGSVTPVAIPARGR